MRYRSRKATAAFPGLARKKTTLRCRFGAQRGLRNVLVGVRAV
jgi:hypothetical protein